MHGFVQCKLSSIVYIFFGVKSESEIEEVLEKCKQKDICLPSTDMEYTLRCRNQILLGRSIEEKECS